MPNIQQSVDHPDAKEQNVKKQAIKGPLATVAEISTKENIVNIDALFCAYPTLQSVLLRDITAKKNKPTWPVFELLAGTSIQREQYYQLSLNWLKHTASGDYPEYFVQSNQQARRHPQRPPAPTGQVYCRYDAQADLSVSFRVFDKSTDMPMFTRWMNDPRVADFWEQAWSQEKLSEFIDERLATAHILPLIAEIDGNAFGYVEVYWVSEDRLGVYYDVQDYDRGIHLLVGENDYRGAHYFNAWMRAITHYIFIDNNRTQRVVLEPRSDNTRLFKRIEQVGYRKQFDFDFPHKRSRLLMQDRQSFFKEQW